MNARMNISGGLVSARRTAKILADLSLSADVTRRFSAFDGGVEAAARIDLYNVSPTDVGRVWGALGKAFGLRCAWIEAMGYAGCILKAPRYVVPSWVRAVPSGALNQHVQRFPTAEENTARIAPVKDPKPFPTVAAYPAPGDTHPLATHPDNVDEPPTIKLWEVIGGGGWEVDYVFANREAAEAFVRRDDNAYGLESIARSFAYTTERVK